MASQIEELAKKRDELNLSVKNLIGDVRSKMSDLKGLNESAKKLKEERDYKNKIVAEFRKKRDVLNLDAKNILAEMKKLESQAKKFPKGEESVDSLRKKAKDLDWKIQTEHHSIKKDEELRDSLDEFERQIAAWEERADFFSKRAELKAKLDKVREEAETLHALIVDNSQSAKKAHEDLIALYTKIKEVRGQVAPVSKKITEVKKQANDAHGELLSAKKSAHENVTTSHSAKVREEEEKMRARAKELFEEFSRGRKLSNEELLIIQRYG